MRTGLTLIQTNIIDADVKTEVSWLFEIDRTGNGLVDDYWSTKAKTWNGQPYTFKVMDFSKIRMERGRSEYGIQAPSSFRFTLTNANNTLLPADFSGGNVTVRLVVSADLAAHADPVDETLSTDLTDEVTSIQEAQILTWNFDIVNVSTAYQTLTFECRDWLRKYIEDAYYPNTPLVHHLWPTNEYGSYDYCIPVVFGTVYTPVPSAWIATDRFYILGIDTPTYTITKARNPDGFGLKVEWLPADFTFTQTTKAAGGVNYKALQVFAADIDSNGVMDANITFLQGEEFLPLSVKFSRNDLATITNPADMIDYILKDFGIPSAKIDATTQASVAAAITALGLTFNAAFVKQEQRETILARLLTMARIELIIRDKIYYKLHSKTSKADIEKDWVLTGSFRYRSVVPSRSDCGYVIYPHVSGDVPVTSMNKALIPAKVTTAVKSSIEVEAFYVFNSQYAQKIGTLELQRQLLVNKDISFTAKGKSLAVEPDDIITINPADYGAGTGATYDLLVDSIAISKDLSVDFSCTGFSAALDDWADLAPSPITIGTDATIGPYQPVTVGPDSDPDATGTLPNVLPGRLRIGEGTSYILFDPASPLKIAEYNAGTEVFRVGNLNGFLGYVAETWGLAIGEANKYLKYDPVNGLRIAGAISASTIDIGGADATSFHVDIDGNLWAGAATFNIATNPFAVSNAGVLRAVSGTIGGFTLSSTALYVGTVATRIQLDTTSGIHLGATAFADAPFRVSLAGALTAMGANITGAISAATIDIGGDDGTSFHVDVDGGIWSGASIANKATAPFRVSNAGALVATSVTVTGALTTGVGSVIDGQFLTALSVNSAAVAASAITTAKIAALAVEAGNIAAGAVTTAKIAALAVTVAEVAADAVTTAKIAALAVTTAKIAGLAVTSNELAAGSVIAGKIAALTIVAADIAAGTITGAKIAATTITAANITALTITAAEIAASTITGAKIAAGTITAANITALTITAAEIAAGTITGAKIAALTITASLIAAGTITADKITVANLAALSADLGAITAGTIALPNTGWIKGGQTDYATGTGFFLGYSTDAYKFSIGSTTKYLKWDGTDLTLVGGFFTSSNYPQLKLDPTTHRLLFYNASQELQCLVGGVYAGPGSLTVSIYLADAETRSVNFAGIHIDKAGLSDCTAAARTNYGIEIGVSTAKSAGANTLTNYGVYGNASGGDINYGGFFTAYNAGVYGLSTQYGVIGEGALGPIKLVPSVSASAPSHTANKGTLWVTAAGILYINTDGGTTWGKVGAQ